MMWKNIFLVFIYLDWKEFHIGNGEMQSVEQLTWIDAQEFCRRHNASLITDRSLETGSDHWIGVYRRLTRWIHIIGCFRWRDIQSSGLTCYKNLNPFSVGACLEYCDECHISNFFALSLQDNFCACLLNKPKEMGLPAEACNTPCSMDESDPFSGECGGKSTDNTNSLAYNVFSSSKAGRTSQQSEIYKTWKESLKFCKDQNTYLYGDVNITGDTGSICNATDHLRTGTSRSWLGIARQNYDSYDKGTYIDKATVTRCTLCSENYECEFVDQCYSSILAYAVCTGNERRTTLMYTSQTTWQQSSEITDVPENGVTSTTAIIVPVLVVLVLACVVLMTSAFLYKRNRKPNTSKNDAYDDHRKKETDEAITNSEPRDNYCILKPQNDSYELAHGSTFEFDNICAQQSSVYYDHLREKRKTIVEDTYHHINIHNENTTTEERTYDHLRDWHTTRDTAEDTYEHVNV